MLSFSIIAIFGNSYNYQILLGGDNCWVEMLEQWHYIMNHGGDEYCRRKREYESWKCDGWAQMTKIHQEIMTANPTPTSPREIM